MDDRLREHLQNDPTITREDPSDPWSNEVVLFIELLKNLLLNKRNLRSKGQHPIKMDTRLTLRIV